MISSVEEFILLLKKWSTESVRIRVIVSFASPETSTCSGFLRVSGAITAMDEQTRVFRIGDEEQFAMVGFTGCRLGYGTGADIQLSSQITDAQLEVLVCLVPPSGLSICLYTVK